MPTSLNHKRLTSEEMIARDEDVCQLSRQGLTPGQIAQRKGLTPNRVCMIIRDGKEESK